MRLITTTFNLTPLAFGGGSAAPAAIQAAPPAPTIDPALTAAQGTAATDEARIASLGGKASTVLTSPEGAAAEDQNEQVARKILLGS
jgi:hypothetical protein